MRIKKKFIIYAFPTSHNAIAFETYCREHDIPGRLIPLPESIAAGCGLCWRMEEICTEQWKKEIQESGIQIEGPYQLEMWTR